MDENNLQTKTYFTVLRNLIAIGKFVDLMFKFNVQIFNNFFLQVFAMVGLS